MKKLICVLIFAIVVAACAFGGCGSVFGGADGKDGRDLNIYDVYEAANEARAEEGLEQLSFLDFLREYLNYEGGSEDEILQASINRSLLSAVALVTDFSYGRGKTAAHAGSGVIVDIDKDSGDAYIVTNAHVVYDSSASPVTATYVSVYLYGNDDIYSCDPIKAEIVNYTVSYDLALIKVTGSKILKNSDARAAVFAEDEQVYAGETVYTVGNPEGCGISVTLGIISRESEFIALDFADGTDAENIYRVIRTDAGTNGGNSGGALYDASGRIVGIINSKDADAENENMGYALCGSYVKRLWKLMRDEPSNGSYGIRCSVFPTDYIYSSTARFNPDTNRTEITDTVYVSGASSGLFMGDIIKHVKITDGSGNTVEDKEITRFYNVDDILISARSGYTVTYTVERGGALKEVSANPFIKALP